MSSTTTSVTKLFEGFTSFDVEVEPDISIHGIRRGNGPPLLLLHGFPQTHHIWHLVAPKLASSYTVIAPDLRGYGASSKPHGSDSHVEYAKSTMARDCVTVMKHLGFTEFLVCGHDRGARVAHKLCVDYPTLVKKVMFLDICPTLGMFSKTDQALATAYFHWFLLIQEDPFPEEMILGNPNLMAEKFFGKGLKGQGGVWNVGIFDEEVMKEYVAQLGNRESVHGMCEDYRAAATVDLAEQRKDIEQGRRIRCPVRVLWGRKGVVGRLFDALTEWRDVSDGSVDGEALDCGHYIPEEKPDEVVHHVMEFLV
ncbi:unnamed protein product [Calypogeia fissa]